MRRSLKHWVVAAAVLAGCGAAVLAAPAGLRQWDRLTAPPPLETPPPLLSLDAGIGVRALAPGATAGLRPLEWVAEGRVLPDPAGGPGLVHEWPGPAVVARFDGDSVAIGFDDPENRFRVAVDGRPAALLTRPGATLTELSGFGPGAHLLRLERLTEAGAPRRIAGIFAPEGAAALTPPAPAARRIDVYGDSDTVGYGNTHAGRYCVGDDVFLSTDTTRSYPAQVARRYGAAASVVARSGMGMIRNYDGAMPGVTMARLHGSVLPSRPAEVAPPAPPPWLTVVEIGANDFATPLGENEPWPDLQTLSADFVLAFEALMRELLAASPGRPILVLGLPDPGVEPRIEIAEVTAALGAEGAPVRMVPLPPLARDACQWHPSVADHELIAGALAETIDRMIADGELEAP